MLPSRQIPNRCDMVQIVKTQVVYEHGEFRCSHFEQWAGTRTDIVKPEKAVIFCALDKPENVDYEFKVMRYPMCNRILRR